MCITKPGMRDVAMLLQYCHVDQAPETVYVVV
jgi:hypothetical protein